jgi:hypothetical protein
MFRRHGMDQWSSNHDTVLALTALIDFSLAHQVKIEIPWHDSLHTGAPKYDGLHIPISFET